MLLFQHLADLGHRCPSAVSPIPGLWYLNAAQKVVSKLLPLLRPPPLLLFGLGHCAWLLALKTDELNMCQPNVQQHTVLEEAHKESRQLKMNSTKHHSASVPIDVTEE